MNSRVSFTPSEPLPGDLQARIDLAQNSISLLQADIRRLEEFKTRLENEVSSLDHLRADKEKGLSETVATIEAKSQTLKEVELDITKKEAIAREVQSKTETSSKELQALKEELEILQGQVSQAKSILAHAAQATGSAMKEHEDLKAKIAEKIAALKSFI